MQHGRCVALLSSRQCRLAVDIVTALPGKLVRRFRTNHDRRPGAESEVITTASVCDGLVCDVGALNGLHCSWLSDTCSVFAREHARLQSIGTPLQHHSRLSRLSRLCFQGVELDHTADVKLRERDF